MEAYEAMNGLLWMGAALLYLVCYALSIRWAYRDAERRGDDGWFAVAFISLAAWPVGLLIWLYLRAGLSFHRDGSGTAWG